MDLTAEGMKRIIILLNWIIDNNHDRNDFTKNTLITLQPYSVMMATAEFVKHDNIAFSIPIEVALNVNSCVLAYSEKYRSTVGDF